jgi:ABC-type branched-subunit amino acid transport system ATPase component
VFPDLTVAENLHVGGFLCEINRGGTALMIVEQSLNIAASLCHRAVFLEKGAVRFEGAPAELLERGDLARAVFVGDGRGAQPHRRH